jgi:hypothetical protein
MNTFKMLFVAVVAMTVVLAASSAFAGWGWDRDAGAKGRGDCSLVSTWESCYAETTSCEPVAVCECEEPQEACPTPTVQEAVAVETASLPVEESD